MARVRVGLRLGLGLGFELGLGLGLSPAMGACFRSMVAKMCASRALWLSLRRLMARLWLSSYLEWRSESRAARWPL